MYHIIKKLYPLSIAFTFAFGILLCRNTVVSASMKINNQQLKAQNNAATMTELNQARNLDTSDLQINSSSSSSDDQWYYNTGTSIPSSATPVYSTYNLLNSVEIGDIVYEANGGYGITGHIAIVEGKFYDTSKSMWYIRVIEAIDDGVVRSILDDTRVDDRNASIYRVSSASTSQKESAVNFCINELGSSYLLDFGHDTSSTETDWYCSELVWAAYYNQGIDIETTGSYNEPGITPRDIKNSSNVSSVSFKS